MNYDPVRVLKQSLIDEWLLQIRLHENEFWWPESDKLDKAKVKETELYRIARELVVKSSFGEAIESGQHDLETIGPRWWEEDYHNKKWLHHPRFRDLEDLPINYGQNWWQISVHGWGPWKKHSVPTWQCLEYDRQMTMLDYSREHIFGDRWFSAYTKTDVFMELEKRLDSFAFSLTDIRFGFDWGFAVSWDYRHFANCILSNLEGKPYLYRFLR